MEFYENIIELRLPELDIPPLDALSWRPYNPQKHFNRFGVSLTSLDGSDSGTPDLDSLLEHNQQHGTNFKEADFRQPTTWGKKIIGDFSERFDCGRSHILRLDQGGFFPYHRDSDRETFRIIYTIQNCSPHEMSWVLERKVLELQDRRWYYVNTKIKHALFSFVDGVAFVVFNVIKTEKSYRSLCDVLDVK